MKTVIYHSGDFDGIFCREIARRFLGNESVTYIGWNFGDKPLTNIIADECYIMDLPCDEPFGTKGKMPWMVHCDLIWIDHHKSSIESHPKNIPGYRIDGVAACRLAWQWFTKTTSGNYTLPSKQDFIDRKIMEPLAVRLAGEYDVWDKRDSDAELFQYGLRSQVTGFDIGELFDSRDDVLEILEAGRGSMQYARTVDAGNMKASFLIEWEGLQFLCLNGRGNSLTFASRDVPETGHDALLMFYTNGTKWVVSLYHAKHRTDLDLSVIAKKMGGGGHRGACGFTSRVLPFLQ